MTQGEEKSDLAGVPETLRTAVERTLSATAGTAAETAERAQELLDEVARRGLEAREEVAKRGQKTREEVARRSQKTREGLAKIRFATADEVTELDRRLEGLERRLQEVETKIRVDAVEPDQSKAEPES